MARALGTPAPAPLLPYAAALCVLALWACGGDVRPPPATRTVAVADTMNGTVVADPYRWLEDQSSTEVNQWIEAQRAYADSIVGATTQRVALASQLRALMDVPNAGTPRKAGDWEYFTLRRKGEEVAAVYRRKPLTTPTPVDPERQCPPATCKRCYTRAIKSW